jgi:hypothetical protein
VRTVLQARQEYPRLKAAGLWPEDTPPGTDPRVWAMIAMCVEGATCAEVGRAFGVTGGRVALLFADGAADKALWWHLHGRFARHVYNRAAGVMYRQELKRWRWHR